MEVLAAVVWLAGFKILNRYAADRRSSSIMYRLRGKGRDHFGIRRGRR
jgi:hypothetical protein